MSRCSILCRCLALAVALSASGCAQTPWLNLESLWSKDKDIKPPPGAINDAVTQANVRRTICSNGWEAAARPPASFQQEAKAALLKQHGIANGEAAKFELDFLVPIGLGGHGRSPENLWLQSTDGTWSARTKDRLEVKLRQLVCSGEITLREAREALLTDWKMAARYYLSDRELLGPLE